MTKPRRHDPAPPPAAAGPTPAELRDMAEQLEAWGQAQDLLPIDPPAAAGALRTQLLRAATHLRLAVLGKPDDDDQRASAGALGAVELAAIAGRLTDSADEIWADGRPASRQAMRHAAFLDTAATALRAALAEPMG